MSELLMLSATVGSKSDLIPLRDKGVFELFEKIVGPRRWRLDVISADRDAYVFEDFVKDLKSKGVKVYWSFAGKANVKVSALKATLRAIGSVAPVFGSAMDWEGLQAALYKPKGIAIGSAGPGLDGAYNTALLACEALALEDAFVRDRLVRFYETNTKPRIYNIDPSSIGVDKDGTLHYRKFNSDGGE